MTKQDRAFLKQMDKDHPQEAQRRRRTTRFESILAALEPAAMDPDEWAAHWLDVDEDEDADFSAARIRSAADILLRCAELKEAQGRTPSPCAPDPRVKHLKAAIRTLQICVDMFPGDPMNPRYAQVLADMKKLLKDTETAHKARREEEAAVA